MRKCLLLVLTITIAACQQEDRPPAPTPEEAERLDAAEAELDELGNGEGPDSEESGPSGNSN